MNGVSTEVLRAEREAMRDLGLASDCPMCSGKGFVTERREAQAERTWVNPRTEPLEVSYMSTTTSTTAWPGTAPQPIVYVMKRPCIWCDETGLVEGDGQDVLGRMAHEAGPAVENAMRTSVSTALAWSVDNAIINGRTTP